MTSCRPRCLDGALRQVRQRQTACRPVAEKRQLPLCRMPAFTIKERRPRAAMTASRNQFQPTDTARQTMTFRPKYITFDCYGTLTRMRMGDMAREMFADHIPADRMEQFLADFSAYRFDEVSGRLAAVRRVAEELDPASVPQMETAVPGRRSPAVLRRRPHLGPARRRAGRPGQGRQGDPAGDPVQRHEQRDPDERRPARRTVPPCLHRTAGAGLQAAPAGLRVHARFARAATPKTCCTSRRACATT